MERELTVFEHLVAAIAKLFFAAGLIAGASGVGALDLPESHPPKPAHTEKTHQPTASPETTTRSERSSFEKLLKECVRRYTGHLDGAKDVCTEAITASGLDADAFWAKYGPLFTSERAKTSEPAKTTVPATPFEALLKECVARYARAASNTKEACEAALRASGLDADAFWAKYGPLMVPAKTKTENPKPVATTKPSPAVELSPECKAKYEAAKAARNGPADVFEALVRSFKATCLPTTEPKPVATTKPSPTVELSPECKAKYEAAKAARNGPADVFEALVRSFKQTCLSNTAGKA